MGKSLEYGRIIWAEVPDPQNRNRKARPLVIIDDPEQLAPEEPFWRVAITTFVPHPLPADYVELPWDRQGRTQTRLRSRSAAVCHWLLELVAEDVFDYSGTVPTKYLNMILEKVDALPDDDPGDESTSSPV